MKPKLFSSLLLLGQSLAFANQPTHVATLHPFLGLTIGPEFIQSGHYKP